MRRGFIRIKGMGYIIWHAKHEVFHVFIALTWAWILRELWKEFNVRWVITAIIGGLIPDIDQLIYYVRFRKRDPYAKLVMKFLKKRQWRVLTRFIETTHKYNTNLSFHNVYVTVLLFGVSAVSYLYDWRSGVVLFGAMVTHYLFDIIDDYFMLGYLNANWKRFGRPKGRARAAQATKDLS
jgi:hypothetical protein